MASLYNHASFSQRRILRIIEGAVKNVSDAHGEEFCPRRARSIAKRATGTLSSQWPEVLAASAPSGKSLRQLSAAERLAASDPRRDVAQVGKPARKGERLKGIKAFPVRLLIRDISRQIRGLKNEGKIERATAFIDVLRTISKLQGEGKSP